MLLASFERQVAESFDSYIDSVLEEVAGEDLANLQEELRFVKEEELKLKGTRDLILKERKLQEATIREIHGVVGALSKQTK